jgi:uncharacterized protein YigE (DUF2233 family)
MNESHVPNRLRFLTILSVGLMVLLLGCSSGLFVTISQNRQLREQRDSLALANQDLRAERDSLQSENQRLQKSIQPGIAERVTYREQLFDTYVFDRQAAQLRLYWQDSTGQPMRSLDKLKAHIEGRGEKLLLATNAGMYTPAGHPQGLFIEAGQQKKPIDLDNGKGNFYLKPNGIFYLTPHSASILTSERFPAQHDSILYATQSGPMLVIDGNIHPAFREGSSNKYIRSGIGILGPDSLVFAISNKPVNFFDFAMLFKAHFGCQQALYLDGAISRAYLPSLNRPQLGGNFGPMMGLSQALRP